MHVDYIVQVFLLDPHNRKAAIDGRTHVGRTLAAMLNFVRCDRWSHHGLVALVRGDLERV